ncbi:hypothetical protein D3C79_911600 [compost metagenome]
MPVGRTVSLNCEFGTDSSLIRSSGAWPPAMPLTPKNKLSPHSSVCRPRRTVVGLSARSNLPKTKASSNSALRPISERVSEVNSLAGEWLALMPGLSVARW